MTLRNEGKHMSTKSQMRKLTLTLTMLTVVCIVAGYAAVAASSHLRPPTVVVTFNISKVTQDLTEKVDAEARLRELVTKIEDETARRIDAIKALQESYEAAAEVDRPAIIEQIEQLSLEGLSYRRFADMRIDNERSLMFRDLYIKIQDSVAAISKDNDMIIVMGAGDIKSITTNIYKKIEACNV